MPKPQYGAEHQARRDAWADELRRTGGRRCACRGQCRQHHGRCAAWLTADRPWDLAHKIAHHHGGDGTDSEPWCVNCNRTEGLLIGQGTQGGTSAQATEQWW